MNISGFQNQWFSKTRHQQSKAKKLSIGGTGLGFRERPGLGSGSSVSTVLRMCEHAW